MRYGHCEGSEEVRDWRFEVSANGWTTDEIGLRWLQKVSIPSTNSRILENFMQN